MNVYSTAGVPACRRTSYWTEVYTSHFAHIRLDLLSRGEFEADLQTGALGSLNLARVRHSAADVEQTRAHVGKACQRTFSFVLYLRGRGVFTHYGRETLLEDGDLTLSDSAEPHHLKLQGPADVIVLRCPADELKPYLPAPETLCGLRLPAGEGLTSTAAVMMRSLVEQLARRPLPSLEQVMARTLLEVITASYAMAFDRGVPDCSIVGARRVQARRFIESHLDDPDLTAAAVAHALDVSPRYLRMVFAEQRETVPAYILRRRLEECARRLASSLWRGQTITDVAFASGFNSTPHFTRAFRERYGVTPRDYRTRNSAVQG